MAERRKGKKKGLSDDEDGHQEEEIKPSKIQCKVADYMKKHVPTKRTKFLNHPVNFFYSNKAIDCLLDSPFATGDNPVFTNRASVVAFCHRLLQLKFYHRAKKIAVTDKDLTVKELKKKKAKEEKKKDDKKKEDNKKKDDKKKEDDKKKDDKKKEVKKEEEEEEEDDDDEESKEDADKKKKKKVRLDMHLEQVFVDSSDAYIWMYDPIPFWYYIAGALLLVAAVAICLFPLWPPYFRQFVYYLSIAAASFLGLIISLAVLRFILFIIIWVLSLGRHHLWILPNLTEDVGFFESFWPLYHYEYKGDTYDDGKKKKKKEKKVKISDNQKSDSEVVESLSSFETDHKAETDGERFNESKEQSDVTDSENSNSHTFEMVNKSELENMDNTEDDVSQEELKKEK